MSIRTLAGGLMALATIMAMGMAEESSAQAYPTRPITMYYPYSGGTQTEVAYRMMNAEIQKSLGQPMVIDMRAGANGRLGVTALKNVPPDGYTVAVVTDSILISQPLADSNFKLELGKDYTPVGAQMDFPIFFFANAAVPYNDVKGLIAYAKANPGKVNFGHTAGSVVTVEQFKQMAGIEMTMIPYKGVEYFTDLAAGRLDVTTGGTTGMPFVKAGKLKVLATSGSERYRVAPDAPTFLEQGVPMVYSLWFGIVAPPGTPADVVARLSAAYAEAVKSPGVQKFFDVQGYNASPRNTPGLFSEYIQAEINTLGPVIRKAGIKMQ